MNLDRIPYIPQLCFHGEVDQGPRRVVHVDSAHENDGCSREEMCVVHALDGRCLAVRAVWVER